MYRILCEHEFSLLLVKYPSLELLYEMVSACLILAETDKVLSMVTIPICIPTSDV